MKKFNITAINQLRVIVVFIGLILLAMILVTTMMILDYANIFALIGVLTVPILLYLYLKKYFTYSISLELSDDSVNILRPNLKLKVHFDEIRSYRVETYHGTRFEIKLKTEKALTIVASDNYGSNPQVLEEFCNQFEKQIKNYQNGQPAYIEREKSFFESNFWFNFVALISVVGFGAVGLAIFSGEGFNVSSLVILVPILFLLPAIINRRNKNKV